MWQVLRHGGRSTDEWRTVLATEDETRARERYDRLYADMRQGGIMLVNPHGETVAREWAPRLRTRW